MTTLRLLASPLAGIAIVTSCISCATMGTAPWWLPGLLGLGLVLLSSLPRVASEIENAFACQRRFRTLDCFLCERDTAQVQVTYRSDDDGAPGTWDCSITVMKR